MARVFSVPLLVYSKTLPAEELVGTQMLLLASMAMLRGLRVAPVTEPEVRLLKTVMEPPGVISLRLPPTALPLLTTQTLPVPSRWRGSGARTWWRWCRCTEHADGPVGGLAGLRGVGAGWR